VGEGKSRRGGAVVGRREEEEEAEAAGPEEEGPSACRGWPVMANRTCAAAAQHDGKRGRKGLFTTFNRGQLISHTSTSFTSVATLSPQWEWVTYAEQRWVGKGSSSRLPSQDRVLSWNGTGSR